MTTFSSPGPAAASLAAEIAAALSAAEYRARTPTSAVVLVGAALQELSALAPAITTDTEFMLWVPENADTGVYIGTLAQQWLLLPGREFVIRSTSLAGWHVKRGGTNNIAALVFGATNT